MPPFTPKPGDWGFAFSGGKESVSFAFPLQRQGRRECDWTLRWASMRPEVDQIPGSCKNWLVVNRWADVANADRGITWVTLDAPVGRRGRHHRKADRSGRRTTARSSQSGRKHIEPTQTPLLVGHEQPLVHELSRIPGRPCDVSLRVAAAPRLRSCRGHSLRRRLPVSRFSPALAQENVRPLESPFRLDSRDVVGHSHETQRRRPVPGDSGSSALPAMDATAEILWSGSQAGASVAQQYRRAASAAARRPSVRYPVGVSSRCLPICRRKTYRTPGDRFAGGTRTRAHRSLRLK